mmetsp:Transcript_23422/g.34836  ORF Transcript_23422/g.34836 Transcript_23422/m.34836 type:complete len:318 (+) Transcript_23422:65-1018(+)|eukprot:CAMPEP_0203674230 /NCGR_PEP_ID=MMETSP0090-20130426/15409_1 /ASSEMBLY_ACC=CAM_ASM_001088 /TAXON_ID=426623 /ORGANISM="Chaetoceros affinis, Strain CCMP159" /LENGTH=317 /DNA_ID=CAMNT_0050540051 /DNA_START=45 /DNA_END=998 /DNA_ORIENTATION=-
MPPNKRNRGRGKRNKIKKKEAADTAITSFDLSSYLSGESAVLLRTKLSESLVWNILNSEIGKCSSSDEVEGTVEAVIDNLFESMGYNDGNNKENDTEENNIGISNGTIKDFLVDALLEYLPDLQHHEQCITIITENVIQYINGAVEDYKVTHCKKGNDTHVEDVFNSDTNEEDTADDSDSDNDDNYIQEGECELCEREVKLTRHHLIPRSTWSRIKPRFLQASSHFIDGDMEKVEEILSMAIPCTLSNDHLSSWRNTKLFLSHYTCSICKLCHGELHRRFDNLELAERWNNVDALLEDEEIRKFCKWANKQRPQRRY